MDSQKSVQRNSNRAIGVMALLVLITLIVFYIRVGFVTAFFICLVAWIIFFFIYFRFLLAIALVTQGLIFLMILAVSIGLLLTASSKESSTAKSVSNTPAATSNKAATNFTLAACASKDTDVPAMPQGYTNIIYSGPYTPGNTVGPDKANNIRTFSFKGQSDKTEKNTMYSHTARSGTDKDGNPLLITGDTVTMEVCNADNMTNKVYSINSQTFSPAGSSTTSNRNAFAGGPYLTGPGTYRIDAYLKIGSGKWQLINRMTGITVTE
jgi:hypothetical protein